MQRIKGKIPPILASFSRVNPRHVLPDIAIIIFSLYASLIIRVGFDEFRVYLPVLQRYLFLFLVLRISAFAVLSAYDIIWRFISLRDCIRIFWAALLSSSLIFVTSYVVDIGRLPRAVFLIDTMLVTILMAGVRFCRRLIYEASLSKQKQSNRKNVLVYGAGMAGRAISNRLSSDTALGCRVAGFIDDDPGKIGRIVSGIKVVGGRKDLSLAIKKSQAKEVYIAIAQPSAQLLRELVQVCLKTKVRPRLVTKLSDGVSSGKNVQTFRDIDLSDLLRRPQRDLKLDSIRDLIVGKKVLVTGAGGSIGSELARQILSFSPALILLLDHSEINLYQIDRELRDLAADSSLIIPLLVDIKDTAMLTAVFQEHSPEVVFHAAAYKHVHLVESNPFPSVINNIAGTLHLLELSEKFSVSTFVLISTDKAVNPAGIMGATKRICEMLVAEMGTRIGKRYCAVRFGNVLGSSGSLIPLLTRQIEQGEPLTITHQDMSRYFMLIPEAVSLVLRAATLAQPGEIAILKMGDPVKIVDLARSLIALMGKSEEEVPIVFTGIRPGEKLCEELYLCGNEIITEDPDVLILPRGDGSLDVGRNGTQLIDDIRRLIAMARVSDKRAIFLMRHLVKSDVGIKYGPSDADLDDIEGKPSYLRPTSSPHKEPLLQ